MNKSKTILLVDDNVVLLRGMDRVLQAKGYQVLKAESAPSAIELWKEHAKTIDLLLTDVVMPGMTGLELADLLRQEKPGLKILIISGFLPEILRPAVEALQSTVFLEKPFKFHTLLDSVHNCLGKE